LEDHMKTDAQLLSRSTSVVTRKSPRVSSLLPKARKVGSDILIAPLAGFGGGALGETRPTNRVAEFICHSTRSLTVALLLGVIAAVTPLQGQESKTGAAAAQDGGAEQTLEQRERAIDRQHLREIYQAIQAYRKKQGDLPNWLSDLYPEFLSDPNVLISPVETRTGQSQLFGHEDPKMRTSYIFEFNPNPASSSVNRNREKPLSMKEWKTKQMEVFGPVTPMVRCLLHEPKLNLAFSGDIYETELFWERDTNTVALMQRLGPGKPGKDASTVRVKVVDAATGRPLSGVEVSTAGVQTEFGPQPPRSATTDDSGQCVVTLGVGTVDGAALRVSRVGYANQQVTWEGGRTVPSEWTARLNEAVAIGGIVRDLTGKPVAGATVQVNGVMRDAVGQFLSSEYDSVTADPSGKWTSSRVPSGFESL
jgi:hypothetical protein